MAEIVLALDLDSPRAALDLLDRLPALRWAKVGPILFNRGGPDLIRSLKERGLSVFLDLKWHDIPNTVAGAVEAASELNVDLVTLHALGGVEMMAAAARVSQRPPIVAVTVLTSHSEASFSEVLGRAAVVEAEVTRLTGMARGGGVEGVVCSAREVREVASAWPESLRIVPGIRPSGAAAGDQVRVASAALAAEAGATHLVVGRPILRADDPAGVLSALQEEARA